MAKGDLYRLAVDAQEFLKQDVEIYRKYYTDVLAHKYIVSYESVKKQTYIQIKKKLPSASQNAAITAAIKIYVQGLYKQFTKEAKNFDIEIEGTPLNFSATVSQGGKLKKTPYDFINDIKKPLQNTLVAVINEVLDPHSLGHHNFMAAHFLDTGHLVAVSDRLADEGLTPIYAASAKSTAVAKLLVRTLNLKIASKFRGNSKIFELEVSEESASDNRRKGAGIEKSRLNSIRAKLAKFISEKDWAYQEGSDSQIEFIEKQLIAEFAKTKGYRGPKPVKPDTKPANAEKIVQSKTKTSKSTDSVSIPIKPARSNINLVALLNAKVSDEIRKRMTYPRLQYRSGRFADSVQVIAASKGLITYTYQRSPYQVFESGVGRSPWNSPERDPRTLIDESIRAAAIGIMSSRFNTRRV